MMLEHSFRLTVLALCLGLTSASGHEPVESGLAAGSRTAVPLHEGLGGISYPVHTSSRLAQRYFDQGLNLGYAFNHAEALRSFRAAQGHDPACAMCFWGEALVLGPTINAPMPENGPGRAIAALEKARARVRDPRERILIEALARRYSRDADADQGALNQAYAEAMGQALERYPDDQTVAVLYAEALMNTSPWNYWEADGLTPRGRMAEAIETAERVLEANPDHVGAIHLYIHLVEASKRPQRAEPHADRLAALVTGAGHLVHMPSHIYFRIGRHTDSMRVNEAAARADERAFERMDVWPVYRHGYYPHNLHFVVASAQMAGDAARALSYAEHLARAVPEEAAASIGWVQRLLAVPYFAHAQFSEPETTLAIPDPGDRFALVKAMWHYARGVAHAQAGNTDAAHDEARQIAALQQDGDFSFLEAWGVPARDLLRLARHVVDGRIARAEGDLDRAIDAFRIAVSIQDALPYLEPPYWYYPVRQSLASALLASGRAGEAVQQLRTSLERFPGNVSALYLLQRAQAAAGDRHGARTTAERLESLPADVLSSVASDRI